MHAVNKNNTALMKFQLGLSFTVSFKKLNFFELKMEQIPRYGPGQKL